MQLFLILVVSNRLLVYMHAGNDTLKGDFERMQLQSAFPICSDYGSEAIVLLIFDQKNFLVFDFFAHITMYLMPGLHPNSCPKPKNPLQDWKAKRHTKKRIQSLLRDLSVGNTFNSNVHPVIFVSANAPLMFCNLLLWSMVWQV